ERRGTDTPLSAVGPPPRPMRRTSQLSKFRQSLMVAALATSLAACSQSDSGTPKPDAPATQDPSAKAEADAPAKPELPAGAELLAAHVEASGGAEAITKFESIHVVGEVAVESQNLRGTMQL